MILRWLTVLIAAGALLGCNNTSLISPGNGGGGPDATPTPTSQPNGITYYKDVLPIVQNKCMACHTEGGVEFALDTYDSARPMANLVAASTFAGRMPPWPPDPDCSSLVGEDHRTLTDAEIDVFQLWADGGAPAGDPDDAPAPPEPAPDTLGPPSVRLDAGGDFNFNNQQEDLYWCFRFDPQLTEPRDVVAMSITPDNDAVVHHVIIFREDGGVGQPTGLPGFECGGVPSGTEFLAGWVPGSEALHLPPDHGMQLDTDDALIMQVHYNADPNAGPTDRSSLDVWYADAPVSNQVRVVWTGSIDINVAPGQTQTVSGTCTVPNGAAPVKVLNISPHMHEIAMSFRSEVEHADGSKSCMIDIPAWDFDWQGGYDYKQPMMLQPGDTISTACTYRNTTNNTVGFGEGTSDEMCFQFNFVVDDGSLPDMCFAPCTFLPCDQLF